MDQTETIQFRLLRKMVNKKFPWILDIKPHDESSRFFFDVFIDPKKMIETYGFEFRDVYLTSLKYEVLRDLAVKVTDLRNIFNMTYKESSELEKEIENTLDTSLESLDQVLPKEAKYFADVAYRKAHIISYIVDLDDLPDDLKKRYNLKTNQ